MNRLLFLLLLLGLPSEISAATLADPPKNTGISLSITKVERFEEGEAGFDLLTIRVANESKANYWIMSGGKDPVEMFSKRNPEALVYVIQHSCTTDDNQNFHIRKAGHWQRTHPLELRLGGRWIKIGPSDQKEISIPVADSVIDHSASIIVSMIFSRDADGKDRFHLLTNSVTVKAQKGGAEQSTKRSDSDSEGNAEPQPESEGRSR
jgi:hypothetical protein